MGKDYGSWLETKFQKLLKAYPNSYSYKFPDYKVFAKMIVMYPEMAGMIQRVPCDRLFVYNGTSFLFELKHTLSERIAISRFAEHQIAHLLKHKAAGGLSFFVIGYNNELIVLNVAKLVSLIKSAEMKSLHVDELREHGENLDTIIKFTLFTK